MELGHDWGRGDRRQEGTPFGGTGSPGSSVALEGCGLTPGTLTPADRIWVGDSTKTERLLAVGVSPHHMPLLPPP